MIAIVALIVIGPEKLPKVARTLGALTGRMQRYMTQIKEEVNREARFEELQRLQQEIQQASNHTQSALQAEVQDLDRSVKDVVEQPSITFVEESVQHQAQKNTSLKE